MSKILISCLLLVTFATSVLNCGIEAFAKDSKNLCASPYKTNCNQDKDGSGSLPENHTSEKTHHCHLSCSQPVLVVTRIAPVEYLSSSHKVYISYTFNYIAPFLDSIERPPLHV